MTATQPPANGPLHVSLIAIPEASASVMFGMYDLLNAFPQMQDIIPGLPDATPFQVEVIGEMPGQLTVAGGTPIQVHRRFRDVDHTDIVIMPALVMNAWKTGRYNALVDWLARQHDESGAILCSACSGIFLIAETGLLDGRRSTVHWSYGPHFRKLFPNVPVNPEQTLVIAGDRGQFVSCGASMSWHDLALYLVARYSGEATARAVAKFYALQWHRDGLAPFIAFEGRRDHGDAAVLDAQTWLTTHFSVADPVEEMVRRSGLAERTFKRRFTNATGYAPLVYVQHLRIEEAKRRLESSNDPVDEIGWQVGYEDPAFFRRLFKRLTGASPGHYRRQFQIPSYALPEAAKQPELAR
jgi:transcriptional regulator GlxA family with amidase domain